MKQTYNVLMLFGLLLLGCPTAKADVLKPGPENVALESLELPPTAAISVDRTSICIDGVNPIITFEGFAGVAPYTFDYTINGIPQAPLTTFSGTSITINVPTGTGGTFTYALTNVIDNTGDSQAENGAVTITVANTLMVDFTSSAAANTCSGDGVNFSSAVTDGLPDYSYQWDFGDGDTSDLENPTHIFTSLGCATATFTVSLTVVDAGGCSETVTHDITVNQQPDIHFTDQVNPFDPFNNCLGASSSTPDYEITVANASASMACITSYSIDWGDGNSESNVSFPLSHIYTQLGAYDMVITAEGTNGCTVSRLYVVKNVTNPSGGLTSPGNTQNLCAPTTNLQFAISNWALNSLETNYFLNYGDGSPAVVLTQGELMASPFYNPGNPGLSQNFPVPHSYAGSNCPATQFVASLTVTNACGSTTFTVDNIIILAEAVPNFISVPVACADMTVFFDNTTSVGFGPNCAQNAMYTWNFGDGTPPVTTTASSPADINHTFEEPGTYIVSLLATNFCGTSDPITRPICIEAPLVPQFTLNTEGCAPFAVTVNNTTDTTESCETPVYLWTVTYASGNCGTVSDFAFTNGTTAASANPSLSFLSPGTYTLMLTATNTCGSFSTSQTITVKERPTAAINPIADVCGPVTINPAATVNSCAPGTEVLSYAWSFPGGVPAVANTAVPGAIFYADPGNHTISLVVTNSCGASVTATESFVIDPIPVVTNTDLAQTICSGSATTAIILTADQPGTTFAWTATASAGISGFTPSGASAIIPAQTISTTNSNPGTVVYQIVPSLDGCAGLPVNYTITVNPAPFFTLQPQSSVVCAGGDPTTLEVAIANFTGTPQYQWFSNTANNTISGTPIPGAQTQVYQPAATVVGTLFYYVVVTLPSGGCSNIISDTASVTIEALPVITSQPSVASNLCVGGTILTPMSVSHSGGTGTVSYQWFSNNSNSNVGGTAIPGAMASSYMPPVFNTPGNFYFYVVVSVTGNGCGSVTSDVVTVVVISDPIIVTQPVESQTLCQGSTPTSLQAGPSGGIGAYTFQWFSNAVNNNTTGTLIAGASLSIYTPPTTTVGSMYYYAVVSQFGSDCTVTSNTAEVIIIPSPTITGQPTSSTVCQGGSPTMLSVAYQDGIGTPSYQWYSNMVNSNVGGTLIPGAEAASYMPPATDVGILYYYVTITFSSGGGCSAITSATATVEITPVATITTQPLDNQTICVGGTTATPLQVAFSGGTGTATYQWFSNNSNSNTGGTLIAGATDATFTPPVFAVSGTFYFYVEITLSGSGCGNVASDVAAITVLEDPIVTGQPLQSQTLCQGTAAAILSVTATGGAGTFFYQWYRNTVNNTLSGTQIAGATSANFTPPTTTVGTVYYYAMISQSGAGCNATTATAEVIIIAAPIITSHPSSSTVCQNGAVTELAVAYANGVGTPTFQWFSNTVDSNTGGIAITGAESVNYMPSSAIIGTIYYYVVVTFPVPGDCSIITSETAMITVVGGANISSQPLDSQNVCVGGTIPLPLTVTFTGGTGTPSYQWFSNTVDANSGGTVIPGANASDFMPPAFPIAGTYYFYAEISLSGSGCGTIVSDVATVNVLADPVIDMQPLVSQTVCDGVAPEALTITFSGGTGTASIQWYANTVNNNTSGTLVSGATTGVFSPPLTAAGTTSYYYAVVTQDVNGCSVSSNTAAVIVNPGPLFTTQPASSSVCLGDTPTSLSVTHANGVGTPTYQWFSNIVNSTVGGTAIPGAQSATHIPQNTVSGTVYYYVVLSFQTGGCPDITSDIATVTISQNPEISSSTQDICSNDTFSVIPDETNGDIVPAGTSYTWPAPTVNPPGSVTGTSAATTPQTSISQTLVNTTSAVATVTYTVTPLSGSCPGVPFTITVTVNPEVVSNAIVSNSSCFEAENGSIETNITGGVPFATGNPYLISWTGPDGFSSSDASIANLAPGAYTLTVTDAGDCSLVEIHTITEPTDFFITTDQENDISCFGADNGSIAITVSGGTAPYTFNWTRDSFAFATTEDIANLEPGIYEITVLDANNCGPKTASFTITEPPVLQLNLSGQTNVLCFGAATGSIDVSVSGGTPIETSPGVFDYNYAWAGPNGFAASTQDLSNLLAGTYNLVLTDASGCTENLTVTITQPDAILITATTTPITCFGGNDASISIAITGGTAPYQISWSNLGTGLFQDNLSAGNYTVTVTDAFNCVQQLTVNIPEAPLFDINPIVTQISCFGENDGSIVLNFVGGIAPITLVWSDGSNAGTTRNNLSAGTYTVTITDSKPCQIVETFVIFEPQSLVLSANITNAFDCDNANSGAINLLVSGGTAPFTYNWSNGSTTEDLNALPAGNYQVTVTDARGCSQTAQYAINRQPPLVIAVDTDTDADCNNREVRQLFEAVVSGGIPPYQLVWSSGTVSGPNNEFMETSQSGTVILEVTDGQGCTANYTFTVDVPEIGDTDFDAASFAFTTFGTYSINDPIQFTNTSTGTYETLVWDFGDGTFSNEENPIHTYTTPGNYVVKMTVTYAFGCVYVAQMTLEVDKGYRLMMPTGFTPNGDAINDIFGPVSSGLESIEMSVYDTWGELIFYEKGETILGWDGTLNGRNAENGNYFFKVVAVTFYGSEITKDGPFTLIK